MPEIVGGQGVCPRCQREYDEQERRPGLVVYLHESGTDRCFVQKK